MKFIFEGRGRDTYYGSPAVFLRDGCIFEGTEQDAEILRGAGFGVSEYVETQPTIQRTAKADEAPKKKKKAPKKAKETKAPAPASEEKTDQDKEQIKERAIMYAKGTQEEKEDFATDHGWDGEQDLDEWFKSGMK